MLIALSIRIPCAAVDLPDAVMHVALNVAGFGPCP